MNYEQTLDYLYNHLPVFQKMGGIAFQANLNNITRFCTHLNHPQKQYPTLHIAGTNGKGSSSHMLAAILQSAGYKVGLYTSPHLKSFTERIKVNGKEISDEEVVQFVETHQAQIENWLPSFFEVTVAMAFDYFSKQAVDIAVIEVGLGGRLDSTNIVQPEVALITNISWDHQQFLGNTLPAIAGEKAGIIKARTPVVISERQKETTDVFQQKSQALQAPLYFAEDDYDAKWLNSSQGMMQLFQKQAKFLSPFVMSLKGNYQEKNIPGVLKTIELLQEKNWKIASKDILNGLQNTVKFTQLKGRWQILRNSPLTICDTGHNEAGVRQVMAQLQQLRFDKLHLIMGTVADKALDQVLPLYPASATYYFCSPQIPRALDARQLQTQASAYGLRGEVYHSVNDAYKQAQRNAYPLDVVFVGGSTFVVAEIEDL